MHYFVMYYFLIIRLDDLLSIFYAPIAEYYVVFSNNLMSSRKCFLNCFNNSIPMFIEWRIIPNDVAFSVFLFIC